MDEERMRVLRMIAEGKITAEEGERLLEALTGSVPTSGPDAERVEHADANSDAKKSAGFRIPPVPPMPPVPDLSNLKEHLKGVKDHLENMKVHLRGAFGWGGPFGRTGPFGKEGPFGNAGPFCEGQEPGGEESPPEVVKVEKVSMLTVRTNLGSLDLAGVEGPELRIQGKPRQSYTVSQHNGDVTIEASHLNGSLSVSVPEGVLEVVVQSNMGKVSLRNLSADLKVDGNTGEVTMSGMTSSDIRARLSVGKISVETDTVRHGSIDLSLGEGKVDLIVPSDSAFEVSATAEKEGKVSTDLPLNFVERGPMLIRGTLNGGGARIHLECNVGKVFLGARKAEG